MSVGKKSCRLEIFFFGWGKKMSIRKKIVGWNFFCWLGKKNSVRKNVGWKISPAIPGNVRTFPGMQDRKTAGVEKKPLGPRPRENKNVCRKKNRRLEFRFCRLGGKNVGWQKIHHSSVGVFFLRSGV